MDNNITLSCICDDDEQMINGAKVRPDIEVELHDDNEIIPDELAEAAYRVYQESFCYFLQHYVEER